MPPLLSRLGSHVSSLCASPFSKRGKYFSSLCWLIMYDTGFMIGSCFNMLFQRDCKHKVSA